jgi:hypothetical protein
LTTQITCHFVHKSFYTICFYYTNYLPLCSQIFLYNQFWYPRFLWLTDSASWNSKRRISMVSKTPRTKIASSASGLFWQYFDNFVFFISQFHFYKHWPFVLAFLWKENTPYQLFFSLWSIFCDYFFVCFMTL